MGHVALHNISQLPFLAKWLKTTIKQHCCRFGCFFDFVTLPTFPIHLFATMVTVGYMIRPDMPMVYFEFPDEDTHWAWDTQVRLIKNEIDVVNIKLEREGRDGNGTLADYREWINFVYSFIQQFGKERLPYDIAEALNSVEEGVGLPLTNFDDVPSITAARERMRQL